MRVCGYRSHGLRIYGKLSVGLPQCSFGLNGAVSLFRCAVRRRLDWECGAPTTFQLSDSFTDSVVTGLRDDRDATLRFSSDAFGARPAVAPRVIAIGSKP
jgi:hypothetical protein